MANEEKKEKKPPEGATETAVERRTREAREREAGELEAEAQAELAEALTEEAETKEETEVLKEKGRERMRGVMDRISRVLEIWKIGEQGRVKVQQVEDEFCSVIISGKDHFIRIEIGVATDPHAEESNALYYGKNPGESIKFDFFVGAFKYDERDPSGKGGTGIDYYKKGKYKRDPGEAKKMQLGGKVSRDLDEKNLYEGYLTRVMDRLPKIVEQFKKEYEERQRSGKEEAETEE